MQFHLTLESPLFFFFFSGVGTLKLPNNLNVQKKKKEKRIQYITQLINTSPFKFSFINRTSCNGLSIKYIQVYICMYVYIILQNFTLL